MIKETASERVGNALLHHFAAIPDQSLPLVGTNDGRHVNLACYSVQWPPHCVLKGWWRAITAPVPSKDFLARLGPVLKLVLQ